MRYCEIQLSSNIYGAVSRGACTVSWILQSDGAQERLQNHSRTASGGQRRSPGAQCRDACGVNDDAGVRMHGESAAFRSVCARDCEGLELVRGERLHLELADVRRDVLREGLGTDHLLRATRERRAC
eukprot:2040322-Pleurochrysis_carterae.AAC.1